MPDPAPDTVAQNLDAGPDARVGVLGASGFTGALAAQILWDHPRFELAAVTAREEAGLELRELHPRHRVAMTLVEPGQAPLEDLDAALVAYPHGAAAPVVDRLLDAGLRVVDLSADFRLADPSVYAKHYGEHGAPDRFGSAAYGLTELARDRISGSRLVANPGCYPTAALLALAPLARAGLIEDVVIDAKSGISGAGRKGGPELHFTTVGENTAPYGTSGHRHRPEIAEQLAALGATPALEFVPHLVPLDQGELVSCYVTAAGGADPGLLAELYEEAYGAEPFVEVVAVPPGVRDVRETNSCHIHPCVLSGGRIGVFAAIDNLWKGAAGQAVQNLNLMLGLDETTGLRA